MADMLKNIGLATALVALVGCDTITTDISASVKVDFTVDATGNTYEETFSVNPLEHKDIKDNADKIKSGTIVKVQVEIISLGAMNAATTASGPHYAKLASASWPDEVAANQLAAFENVPLTVGQVITMTMSTEQNTKLADLLFPEGGPQAVDAKIVGTSDMGPINFEAKAIIDIEVQAGLI